MAKQLVSPVERHIEKVVLGIAGLILIGVIAQFLVTTPNRIELRGDEVVPSQIDQIVAEQALDVQQRLANAPPPEIEVRERYPEFVASVDPELPPRLPRAVALLPPVPVVEQAIDTERIEPVEVVQLPPPVVATGRSTLELVEAVNEGGEATSVEALTTNWATVTSVFDWREQYNRQDKAYQAVRRDVIVADVELQRRQMRSDGSWSDDDWADVTPYRRVAMRQPPQVELYEEEDRLLAEPSSIDDVERYEDYLKERETVLRVLRPLPPYVLEGTLWRVPVYPGRTRLEVLREDEFILYPNDPPADVPEDRYPDAVKVDQQEKAGSEPAQETPKQKIDRLLREGQELMKQARDTWNVDVATRSINRFVEVQTSPSASGEDKRKAERLYREARQLKRDIIRYPQGPPGADQPIEQPDVREQVPTQQVWVHDMHGGLLGGRSYQFRMRVVLLNRYAAIPSRLADPEDARRVVLRGEWSEPCAPVYFEPHYYDFVTGIADRGGQLEAKIELYRWFEGYWVETRERFAVGEWLRTRDRCPVPWREDPSVIDRPQVPFDSEAMLLDIEVDRPFWERKRGRGDGPSFRFTDRGAVAVIVGADGELREHYESTERDHPQRKKVKEKVFRPPAGTGP